MRAHVMAGNIAADPKRSALSSFLSWWRDELIGMLPSALSGQRQPQARTILSLVPDGVRIVKCAARPPRRTPQPQGDAPLADVLDFLARMRKAGRAIEPIALQVPAATSFTRSVEIPAAARRDLERMMALDLERTTPFRLGDVLTAIEVDPAGPSNGQIKVQQIIVKRKPVFQVVDEIKALGLDVSRIEAGRDEANPIPLTSPDALSDAPAKARPTGMAAMVLLGAIALLSALAVYLYVDRHQAALQELQAQNAKMRAQAASQKSAVEKANAAQAAVASYKKLRSKMVSRAMLLEELSRVLPDTAWVSDLRIEDATIDISGQAKSAASLLPLLESSSHFIDASFSSTVTLEHSGEKERFSIRARIRGADLGESLTNQSGTPP